MSIKELFCQWFSERLPHIKKDYKWTVPLIPGFEPKHQTCYENTVALKKFFYDLWCEADNEHDQINVARMIVGEWGGIKTNTDSTFELYVGEVLQEKPTCPLNGLSSYSRFYSVIRPEEFAFYDARVTACLNAIQYNRNKQPGVVFSCNTTSRNSIIQAYFALKEFKPKYLKNEKLWYRIPRNDIYRAYNELLQSCLVNFPEYKLYDLEMALSHYSIEECSLLMKKTNNFY